MKLKKLNIAEWLAMWRVVSFPIILGLILLDARNFTAWLYMIFFSTDMLDGLFAKLFNMESERRARLDTLGDVFYLLTGTYGYYVFETDHFRENLLLIALVFGAYLLQLAISMLKWGAPSTYHTWLAKITAFVQVAFLVSTLFLAPSWLLFYLTIGISLLDALEDIAITLLLRERISNIRGLPWLLVGKGRKATRLGGKYINRQ